ncbi:MAG: O-antigen ligase family protein [Novosphingobium sp.]
MTLAPARFAPHALLVLALVFGGGGSPAPLNEMALEWAALLALVIALWFATRPRSEPALGWAVAVAVLALPALQLVPLPPGLWQDLPGRTMEAAALALVDAGGRWMPLAVSPPRTLAALLALVVPLVLLVLTARSDRPLRTGLIAAVAGLAVLSALVGIVQLAGPALEFYAERNVGYLTGFQANRNAQADVLLIGIVALAALAGGRVGRDSRSVATLAGIALLAVAILFTGSRAGIALLVPTLTGVTWWLGSDRLRRVRPASLAALSAVVAAGAGALLLALRDNPVAGRIAARFGEGGGPRPELWSDTLFAAGLHWPWGSGLGSFVPVFVAAERLEMVDPSHPNRAHNDYLEFALEAGAPGMILLAGLAALLAWCLRGRWRAAAAGSERAEVVFAGSTLLILAAHSIVDYPLRSMALAALLGVASGIVAAPRTLTMARPARSGGQVETSSS